MYSPQKYSKNIEPVVNIIRTVFLKNAKLLKWKSEPESIMDLGVGDGRMTKEVILPSVTKNIKEYVGADISEVMLKNAEKTIDHEKFRTVVLDAQTKKIPVQMKNRFHHIFANFLLHQTRDTR